MNRVKPVTNVVLAEIHMGRTYVWYCTIQRNLVHTQCSFDYDVHILLFVYVPYHTIGNNNMVWYGVP